MEANETTAAITDEDHTVSEAGTPNPGPVVSDIPQPSDAPSAAGTRSTEVPAANGTANGIANGAPSSGPGQTPAPHSNPPLPSMTDASPLKKVNPITLPSLSSQVPFVQVQVQPQPLPMSTQPRPPVQHHTGVIHRNEAEQLLGRLGRHKMTGDGKLHIQEPPGKQTPVPLPSTPPGAMPPSKGFPSPLGDHSRVNPKFIDDIARLTFAVQQSLPEAVRRVVRDNWQKCLLGSDFHQVFIMNATVNHAVSSVTKRAFRDFGAKMVMDCKEEIVHHFTTAMLDDVADDIIAKASWEFLDKCLAQRLQTIDAPSLINALAKAHRLGYDQDDVVEDGNSIERVIPSQPYNTIPPSISAMSSQPQTNDTLQCQLCFRIFTAESAYIHHTSRKVCSRAPPTAEGFKYSCKHCGQGFSSVGGLHYHNACKVCGDFGEPNAPPHAHLSSDIASTPVPVPAPGHANALDHSPAVSGARTGSSTPRVPTPSVAVKTPSSAINTPTSKVVSPATANDPNGPYAHLTPEQMTAMQEELRLAEIKYADRFQEAEAIADPNERRTKLDGLRNSFGTKQSMIRKKFGVRLRERRTKAEIQAERERMGLDEKRPRPSEVLTPKHTAPNNVTTRASTRGSGWTPANANKQAANDTHGQKRRRTDNGSWVAPQPQPDSTKDEPPRQRVAAANMAGRPSRSPAAVATRGPTRASSSRRTSSQPPQAYRKSGTRADSHRPNKMSISSVSSGANGTRGTGIDTVSASSDSSDDEDIPAVLPAHIRQSLSSASKGASSGGGGL